MAPLNQRLEAFQEALDVVMVEARRGLVEDEHRGLALLQAQIVGQLDALVLAAREGGGALAQFDVAQTHILQRLEQAHNLLLAVLREELHSLVDGHIKHVVDVLPLVAHLQHIGLEALAVTRLALEHEVGHKLHLHRHGAFALALLAAAALGVEGEMRRRELHLLRQWL